MFRADTRPRGIESLGTLILRIDKAHIGAREYIGEAYLMVGNAKKAKEHLKALQQYCAVAPLCQEVYDLRERIDDYERKSAKKWPQQTGPTLGLGRPTPRPAATRRDGPLEQGGSKGFCRCRRRASRSSSARNEVVKAGVSRPAQVLHAAGGLAIAANPSFSTRR